VKNSTHIYLGAEMDLDAARAGDYGDSPRVTIMLRAPNPDEQPIVVRILDGMNPNAVVFLLRGLADYIDGYPGLRERIRNGRNFDFSENTIIETADERTL
jgi:hypothetical protein